MANDILKEILKDIPKGKISEALFEGANIVLYTKDADFFLDDKGLTKKIVNKIKKRIELRPDPSLSMTREKAEEELKKIIPEDAGIDQIIFDPQRSVVIIEAEKPGLVIGKNGSTLQEIKSKTLWVPIIKRKPPIRSELIENIRSVLYQNSDYRKKFLHKTGQRIYDGWLRQKKHEWIRLTMLGAGRQVGRSCLLLQTPESRILLDCGIDVSNEKEMYPILEAPEFDLQQIDAIIIGHSHIDHTGLLPYLFKFGYRGPVYCTEPTRDVMALLQLDSVKLMRGEGKEPIFTSEDIKEMVKHTITLNFEEVTDITPDIRITLYNSGHILGAAMVHMHIGNGLHNLMYTGDLKYAKTQLLAPAHTTFPRLESMIIESTYGGRNDFSNRTDTPDKQMQDIIVETVKRGGKVLCPVLGSGRAQEIMVILDYIIRKKMIKEIPVCVDGLVWDITAIHTAYPEFFNSSVKNQIFHKDNNPFLGKNIKRVGSNKERQEVIESDGPCIILATSGMLVGGPSVEYLKKLGEDDRHSLVFSSYQGPGTLGRRIMNGETEIAFPKGNKVERVNLKIEQHRVEITNHSDRKELMNFVKDCSPRPRKIVINHGESKKCLDLASAIHKTYRIETVAPKNLESVRIY